MGYLQGSLKQSSDTITKMHVEQKQLVDSLTLSLKTAKIELEQTAYELEQASSMRGFEDFKKTLLKMEEELEIIHGLKTE